MDVTFHGTRGGIPTPGRHTVRYGGNTTSIAVTARDGTALLIDGGTGLRNATPPGPDITLLLTHVHWDHIQGIPFAPIFLTHGAHITIYGPQPSAGVGLHDCLAAQMAQPCFPVTLEQFIDQMALHIDVVEIDSDTTFSVGGIRIAAHRVNHPGMTVGYRFDDSGDGASAAFVPDNELGLMDATEFDALAAWASGVDILIHDAQYTTEEITTRHRWGHSTFDEASSLATCAGAGRLAFFHHDPGRTDATLDRIVRRQQQASPGVTAAREGDTISVGPMSVRPPRDVAL